MKQAVAKAMAAFMLVSGINPGPAMIPKEVSAASVAYDPAILGEPVLPNRDDVVDAVKKSSWFHSHMDWTGKFGITARTNININSDVKMLTYNRTYQHNNNDCAEDLKASYEITSSAMKELVNSKHQLKLYVEGTMVPDYHSNFKNHWDKMWRCPELTLTTGDVGYCIINGKVYYYHYKPFAKPGQVNDDQPQAIAQYNYSDITSSDPDENPFYGDVGRNKLELAWTGGGWCNCGTCKLTLSGMYMKDTWAPKITDVYAARLSGSTYNRENNGFKAGETGYVVLNFSENIRFSDHTAKDLTLKLDCIDASNDQQLTDKLTASLVSLKGKQMIFSFTVPSTFNNKSTNVYISSISGTQDWTDTKDGFGLAILNAYNTDVSSYFGTFKCNSAVTDLAGNALDWSGSKKAMNRFYLDNVAPQLEKVTLDASMQKGVDLTNLDSSNTYAGPGDTLTFDVYFSEELNPNSYILGNVSASLNLKKSGNTVTARAKSANSVSAKSVLGRNASSGNLTKMTFETVTVDSEMSAADTNTIRITGISGLDSAKDLRGNTLGSVAAVTKAPANSAYVDTAAPTVSISGFQGDGAYTPASANRNVFTVPLVIQDSASGVLGQSAEAALSMSGLGESQTKSFEYCIDTNAQVTESTEWKSGTLTKSVSSFASFVLLNATQTTYIHIRLDDSDSTGYNWDSTDQKYYFTGFLKITAQDNAGNPCTKEFKLRHAADSTTAPVIEKVSETHVIHQSGTGGTVTVRANISDNFSVKAVQYQWGNQALQSQNVTDGGQYDFTYDTGNTQSGTIELKVYASDYGNHQQELVVPVEYKFETKKADYTFAGGSLTAPVRKPSLSVSSPGTASDVTYRTLTLAKDTNGSQYYVAEEGTDLFASVKWRKASVSVSGNVETVTYQSGDALEAFPDVYGSIDIRLLTVRQDVLTPDGNGVVAFRVGDANSYCDVVNLKSYVYGASPAVSVTMEDTVISAVDGKEISGLIHQFYPNGTHHTLNRAISSISDAAFTVRMSNSTTGEAGLGKNKYGLNIVKSATVEVYRKNQNANYESTRTYAGTMAVSEEQKLTFPDSAAPETGWYYLKITVTKVNGQQVVLDHNSNGTVNGKFFFVDKELNTLKMTADYSRRYAEAGFSSYYVFNSWNVSEASDEIQKIGIAEAGQKLSVKNELKLTMNYRKTDANSEAYYKNLTTATLYYRIYSSRDENGAENAPWCPFSADAYWNAHDYTYPVVAADVTVDETTGTESISFDYGTKEAPKLPVATGINTLYVQVKNAAGVVTTVGQIMVDASAATLSGMAVVSKEKEKTYEKLEPAFSAADLAALMGWNDSLSHLNSTKLTTVQEKTYVEDTSLLFCAYNAYGNVAAVPYEVTDVDGVGPYYIATQSYRGSPISYDSIQNMDAQNNPMGFHFYVYCDDGSATAEEFYLTFDREYSYLLTGDDSYLKTGEDQKPELTIPIPVGKKTEAEGQVTYDPWWDFGTDNYGIYHTEADQDDTSAGVEVWGQFKYDNSKAEGAGLTRTITLTARDQNGNISRDSVILSCVRNNRRPHAAQGLYTLDESYNNFKLENEGKDLFRQNELCVSSCVITDRSENYISRGACVVSRIEGHGANGLYYQPQTVKFSYVFNKSVSPTYTTMPDIKSDGTYDVRIVDLFGQVFTDTLRVDAFSQTGLNLEADKTTATRENVTVTATASEGYEVTEMTYGTLNQEGTFTADTSGTAPQASIADGGGTATITLTENGVVQAKAK